jgi:phage/conjugal plasmid C-4 type zinc finger TraR family protein
MAEREIGSIGEAVERFAFGVYYYMGKIKKIWKRKHLMAVGWSRDGAVQDQIDASVGDAVKLARSRLPDGEGPTHCEQCEEFIPLPRRHALPGVRLCVRCQSELEKQQTTFTGYNRRGSKDSQLK